MKQRQEEDALVGRPERSYNNVVFGFDSDYAYAGNIIKNLYLGPGEPGPGDEWKMPTGPVDELVAVAEDAPKLDPSGRVGLLGRLGRPGRRG
jgi:hypothetical protein